MGNNSTVEQCFVKLGIPELSQAPLRRDFINKLGLEIVKEGGLTSISSEELSRFTKEYIHHHLHKYQLSYNPSTSQEQRSEADLHEALLQLATPWLHAKQREASQEDPSYTSSSSVYAVSPKKRKRPSGPLQPPKEKLQKKNATSKTNKSTVAQANRVLTITTRPENSDVLPSEPRSATIDTNFTPLHHIPYRNSQEDPSEESDELPELQRLISRKQAPKIAVPINYQANRITPSTSRKGKAPVRDPPSPILAQASSSKTRNVQNSISPTNDLKQSATVAHEIVSDEEDNATLQLNAHTIQAPTSPRKYRSAIDIERSEEPQSQNTSPTISNFATFTAGAQRKTTPPTHETSLPPSPPPTVRRTLFRGSPDHAAAGPSESGSTIGSRSREEKLIELLYSIPEYFAQCERRSIAMEQSSESERERQKYQISAVVLAHARADTASRIDAFLKEDNGARGMSVISSHCLWF